MLRVVAPRDPGSCRGGVVRNFPSQAPHSVTHELLAPQGQECGHYNTARTLGPLLTAANLGELPFCEPQLSPLVENGNKIPSSAVIKIK